MPWTDLDEMMTGNMEARLDAAPSCIQTEDHHRCVDLWPETTQLWCYRCSLEVGVYLWHAKRESVSA